MRRELEQIDVPGEHDARERTWSVVQSAFDEREPTPQASHWPRVAAVAIALSAVLAAALSPPGRAVLDEIREVVGVERAQPALFSLPAPGQLLVASDAGVWVVQEDGSKRLLGPYREASWSPFGRYVVAARQNELAALEPDGDVRWTLARPGVRSPRWTGTEADTRIAYVDRTGLRVVAGDGSDDRLLAAGVRGPIAWRPGARFLLAYATPRAVRVVDSETGRTLWQVTRPVGPVDLEWSSDGSLLLVLATRHIRLYGVRGYIFEKTSPKTAPYVAGARPRSGQIAAALSHAGQSKAYIFSGRTLFNGTGVFQELLWSPGGRWVLVTWPTADQWVFVDAERRDQIRAVSNISEQFRSRSFPQVQGWCCAP